MAYQADVSNLGFKLAVYSIVAGVVLTFGAAYIFDVGFFSSINTTTIFSFLIWMLINYAAFVIFIVFFGLFAVSFDTLVILFIIDCVLVLLLSKIHPIDLEILTALYTPGIISWSYFAAVRRKFPAPKVPKVE